jgi:hypothetical protein
MSKPRSLILAERGVTNDVEAVQLSMATMADVLAGRITPKQANAIGKRVGELLKAVESAYGIGRRANRLCAGNIESLEARHMRRGHDGKRH